VAIAKPSPTRIRLLKVALKHYSGAGLAKLLKVSDEQLVDWLEEREDIPPGKMLQVIDLLDAKQALGEDF
jgi:succinate dehydrogenase flavin-adding protein (antitoxin of CptAB toxin-antitoxin module)